LDWENNGEGETIVKCVLCEKQMHETTTIYRSRWGQYELTIKGITAHKCEECDRLVFNPEEARMIQNVTAGLSDSSINEKPQLLNVTEVADLLRVSNQTVYNMIKDGRLSATKVGREWRFLRKDVLNALKDENNSPESDFKVAARGKLSEKDKIYIEVLFAEEEE